MCIRDRFQSELLRKEAEREAGDQPAAQEEETDQTDNTSASSQAGTAGE